MRSGRDDERQNGGQGIQHFRNNADLCYEIKHGRRVSGMG